IVTVTRHPVLWGFILWAASHLVASGDLRSVLLFGALALFGASGIVVTERRNRRRLGKDCDRIAQATTILPFAGYLTGSTRPRIDGSMIAGLAVALMVTAWLLPGGHFVCSAPTLWE